MGATAVATELRKVGDVSTHAPVMGATIGPQSGPLPSERFNPRARDGRDHASERPGRCQVECFNPRARDGRDGRQARNRQRHRQFQPTRP